MDKKAELKIGEIYSRCKKLIQFGTKCAEDDLSRELKKAEEMDTFSGREMAKKMAYIKYEEQIKSYLKALIFCIETDFKKELEKVSKIQDERKRIEKLNLVKKDYQKRNDNLKIQLSSLSPVNITNEEIA